MRTVTTPFLHSLHVMSMSKSLLMSLLLSSCYSSGRVVLPVFVSLTAVARLRAPLKEGSRHRLFSTSQTKTTSLHGNLEVRILPRKYVDYEQHMPHHVAVTESDLQELLRQVGSTLPDLLAPGGNDMPQHENAHEDDDDVILLQAHVFTSDNKIVVVSSHRERDELASQGLKRLTKSLRSHLLPAEHRYSKVANKKVLKRKGPSQTPSDVPILKNENDEVIDVKNLRAIQLWRDFKQHGPTKAQFSLATSMKVDLMVKMCLPTVVTVQTFEMFEASVYVGVPLHVSIETWHATRTRILWFVDGVLAATDSNTYIPTEQDVNKHVQVLLIPISSCAVGRAEAYKFVQPVQALPDMPVIRKLRPEWTHQRIPSDTRLRLMTYNVFADQYAKMSNGRHVPPEVLQRRNRMPLVVYELLAYHADILCLQEVDWYIFDSLYKPILESQGYQGIFNCKKSGQQEGCAMFWLKDRLECIENDWVGISETVLNKHTDDWCEHETLLQQLPHLINRFEQLGQTLQLAKFVDKRNRNRGLMVGNTHLYYHPLGDHIRVLQTYGVCRKMHEWQRKQPDFSVVLCGDLNSDPKSGAFQFLTTGELQSSSSSWKNLLVHPPLPRKGSNDSTDTEKCALPPLLTFASDFQTLSPSCLPLFTHCIPEFSGTLDYIFTTSSLACVAFAPMPEEPIFLPNTGVPSDHISLVADYEWR